MEATKSTIPLATKISSVVKDARKAFPHVPCIKAITVALVQLVHVQKKVRRHERRCSELVGMVYLKTYLVLEVMLEAKAFTGEQAFKDILAYLVNYQKLLEQILVLFTQLTKWNLFDRIFDRGSDELNKLDEADRRIRSYADNILLSEARITLRHLTKKDLLFIHEYTWTIPPPPTFLVERQQEKEQIVATLLSSSNTRIAVLGPGGIGKTTLITAALHDTRIIEKYPRRYFISFEGLLTTEAVYAAFVNTLAIEPGFQNSDLLPGVISHLEAENSILCLDGFETFWEPMATRSKAEEILGQLASTSSLAILVTMRGTHRPQGIEWAQPMMDPLPPLSMAGSREIVTRIAGGQTSLEDENGIAVKNLLEAAEGSPLSVTLISSLLSTGEEEALSLWDRWCQGQPQVLSAGGVEGASACNMSITLSLNSPAMASNPDAKALLAAMAILPDGLLDCPPWLEGFQKQLPAGFDVRRGTSVLLNLGLLSLDKSTTPPRLRLLSPIRQYCLDNLPLNPNSDIAKAIMALYISYAEETNHFSQPPSNNFSLSPGALHARILPELNNLRAVLGYAFSRGMCSYSLVAAAMEYSNWTRLFGGLIVDVGVLKQALGACERAGIRELQATVLRSMGWSYRLMGQYADAVSVLSETRVLLAHVEVGLRLDEEADVLVDLGNVYLEMGEERWDEARECLETAVALNVSASNNKGEAIALQALGSVYMKKKQFEEAGAAFERALAIHRSRNDAVGEARVMELLAGVHEGMGKFDMAELALLEVLKQTQLNGDAEAQVGVLVRLGQFYSEKQRNVEALKWYQKAMELSETVNHPGMGVWRENLRRLVPALAAEVAKPSVSG